VLEVETLAAVTVKIAEVEPWGTVTLKGTVATDVFELERATAMPPLPAGSVKVTVPVPVSPLVIDEGLTETELNAAGGGFTVRPNVRLAPE
jgi:hypothetical protein